MSVNSVSGGSSYWQLSGASGQDMSGQGVQGTGGRHRHHGQSPIDSAAKALGMSVEDLKSELKQNKSLDDVAAEKGVSHDDLAAALKVGMPKDGPQAAQGADADSFIEAMTSQKGGPRPPEGGGHHGFRTSGIGDSTGVLGASMTGQQSDMLDSLSSLLGTSTDDLVNQLQSGTSLASLVSSKGVSSGSLAQVLQDGLLLDTKA